MELANGPSIYKRYEPLVSHCTSSNAARGLAPRLSRPNSSTQKSPRTPYIRCVHATFRHLSRPNFWVFPSPFLRIFKNFFAQLARHRPPCAESPRRTLVQPKNPGIPRQNAPCAPRRRPDFTRKHRLGAPENPPLTRSHEKKLSLFHSTLLTAPPRGCILEYMRLKAAAQTTPHGAASAAPTASKTFKLTRLALEEAGH